ncbi:MAG: LacI family DNA-binding transcriptional regulator [Erysipelotrichaceae bacterium]|nr:LacI family DNA-binding transcriptional regulator [Erysipelotrichaceae bacterium]
MTSIKDIAKECGVSVATVSKALNDQKDISQTTKDRVLEVAKQMGYTTNQAAKALRTNKTNNIGILFTNVGSDITMTHEFFSQILESFKYRCEKRGYDITFINNRIGTMKTSYLNHAIYRNFDGVAIIAADFNDPSVKELAESNIPVVAVDYMYDNCATVLSDNKRGIRAIVQHAYNQGHRKIAFIHGERTEVTLERLSGFYAACLEFGIEVRNDYLYESKYHDINRCADCLEKLISMEDRPTCIIFSDDYSLIGSLNTVKKRGIDIPEDLSFAGYDGITMAKTLNITTYEQDADGLGKAAAIKLIDIIENNSKPETVILPGKFNEGVTIKKLN